MHTVGREIGRETLKNLKNEKCTLQDVEYGKKTEKCVKWDTYTVGPKIWREKLKRVENKKCTLQDLEQGDKTGK